MVFAISRGTLESLEPRNLYSGAPRLLKRSTQVASAEQSQAARLRALRRARRSKHSRARSRAGGANPARHSAPLPGASHFVDGRILPYSASIHRLRNGRLARRGSGRIDGSSGASQVVRCQAGVPPRTRRPLPIAGGTLVTERAQVRVGPWLVTAPPNRNMPHVWVLRDH